jgi:hypothetical protein
MTKHTDLEAGRLYRRLPAAKRRADVAKSRAGRTGHPEHVDAAVELEAGYQRMTLEYFNALAQVV